MKILKILLVAIAAFAIAFVLAKKFNAEVSSDSSEGVVDTSSTSEATVLDIIEN